LIEILFMKKKLTMVLSGAVLAGTLALALPTVFAESNVTATPMAENRPAIHHAIEALEAAKTEMQHAGHDFGGHREAAVIECDKAIMQLKEALKFDK
jgi:hypothetical protein